MQSLTCSIGSRLRLTALRAAAISAAALVACAAPAQYPCDANGDGVIDGGDYAFFLANAEARTFLISGSGNGTPWDWALEAQCNGVPTALPYFSVGAATGVTSGTQAIPSSAAEVAAAFAASINLAAGAVPHFFASATPGQPILEIVVLKADFNDDWALSVAGGGGAACQVTSGQVCQFNPTIQIIEITDPCSAECPADLDGSGIVDGADLGAVLASWGTSHPCVDLDGSGTVDGADLGLLLASWGTCVS